MAGAATTPRRTGTTTPTRRSRPSISRIPGTAPRPTRTSIRSRAAITAALRGTRLTLPSRLREKTMPLHFATEPKNGTALVQKALSKLATRPSPLSERAVDFNALQVQQPHAVYDLRADAIAHGEGLASAKASGFRYLIGTGGTTVAAAEVLADANGNATVLANVNHGPYVEATARALAQVATLSAVGAGSYEVRLLRFSAIGLMALWLKPDAGGADIIY